MAFFFSKSTPATGAVAMYELVALLVSVGWSVLASSDGTTYNSSGMAISSGASGAGGFANNSAWVRIRMPGGAGAQEYTIQRGTTNLVWRIKRSRTNPFNGGSPGATQTPSATNEGVVIGGGTDAAPTFATFHATDNTYRWHCAADNAAPYGFWSGAYPVGGGNPGAVLILDPLSFTPPGDADPYLLCVGCTGSNQLSITTLTAESGSATTTRMLASVVGTAPTTYQQFPACKLSTDGGDVVPSGLATDPITTKDPTLPMILARRAALADPAYKGQTTIMRWLAITRGTGNLLQVSTPNDRIVYRAVSLPWDGSTPAV